MIYTTQSIIGKWNKKKYTIIKKLGQGGVGTVYKVKDELGTYKALKISNDMNSITREYENMKKLKGISCTPSVYDIDDYEEYGKIYYFLVMDIVEGYNLKEAIRLTKLKLNDILIIGITLLNSLEGIYNLGYIYSDIKLENIMIDKVNKNILLIDYGSVIENKYCIKEYTPTYNMASWGIGLNKGYTSNLIFSVNMIIVSMLLGKEYTPLVDNIWDVKNSINKLKINTSLKKILIKALNGKYDIINNYKEDLKNKICIKKDIHKTTYDLKVDMIDMILAGSICFVIAVLILGIK
ncbi:putative serine/threonine-protein kinase YabT [Gottschalkia purinilytica]|uniref:Putative serine/threonine-protein kinase YabT n=1 Tax=Gottschalkia purinilytica TaxID=1503 RepID=A0A0L0W8E5_GOTPU|nr:hypothetical protein [Gottschalkia purinilytica]KNF07819.1 putative serine/threonine-protein kinase YabT [Gottschalkia purinilytica]